MDDQQKKLQKLNAKVYQLEELQEKLLREILRKKRSSGVDHAYGDQIATKGKQS